MVLWWEVREDGESGVGLEGAEVEIGRYLGTWVLGCVETCYVRYVCAYHTYHTYLAYVHIYPDQHSFPPSPTPI